MFNSNIGINFVDTFFNQAYILVVFKDETSKVILF